MRLLQYFLVQDKKKKQGEPAAGQTGKNLDMLLELLNKSLNYIGNFTREDVT